MCSSSALLHGDETVVPKVPEIHDQALTSAAAFGAYVAYTVPDMLTDMYPWMTPASPDWDLANTSFLAAQSSLAVQRQKFKDNAPAANSSAGYASFILCTRVPYHPGKHVRDEP